MIERIRQAVSQVPETVATPGEESLSPLPVAVSSLLDRRGAALEECPEWRLSIVDLLKLMEVDHSFDARQEMAVELGYLREELHLRGSAELNLWLHSRLTEHISQTWDGVSEGAPSEIAA